MIENGKVYLVGAGPGDPDLLTVKARKLLARADLILHDDLVPPRILALANPRAEIMNVGKRCGVAGATQAEIDSRMIAAARAGSSVVRLKGGDPAIFGRLAEEIDALDAAAVPWEVVPGITAGLAAAAALGASLTDRRKASRVVIVTNHHAGTKRPLVRDWQGLAREDATLVIYMPGNDFEALRDELLAAGLSADIPAALVSRAASAEQSVECSTLAELHALPRVPAPSILLVGWALDSAVRRALAANSAALLADAELAFASH
ncbi:MAG: uroporphyrinogen-III C-methyltransferase [Acidobacteriota bacterium]|nr:uroporphyrinogen-III C-methyltransferase [Acidobacteriota bacterium]MDE3168585.1 uroporphyrinogen-III C-methyltransferase [Acidobacteriota bacterium]